MRIQRYYVRLKRCGECLCCFMSSQNDENASENVTARLALNRPSEELVNRADDRLDKMVGALRYLTQEVGNRRHG